MDPWASVSRPATEAPQAPQTVPAPSADPWANVARDANAPAQPTGPGNSIITPSLGPVPTAPQRPIPNTATAGDLVGKAADWVGNAAKNLWTGDDHREFDYPELPATLMDGIGGTQERMSLARGDLGKLDILRKMAGNIPASMDKFGNVYITLNGTGPRADNPARFGASPGNYYLNRPGASQQDVADLISSAIPIGIGALAGGQAGGKVGGTPGRIAGAAAGAGAGSIAQDVGSQLAGSERPVDPVAAAVSAAFGLGGESAQMAGGWLIKKFLPSKVLFDTATNTPTDAGRQVLAQIGIDPTSVGKEFWANFSKLAKNATDPAAAGRLADLSTLPVSVRLSTGDISRDVTQQGLEDAMLKGQLGAPAKTIMSDFRTAQQGDIAANVPKIQAKIGGVPSDASGMTYERAMQHWQSMYSQAPNEAGRAALLAQKPNPADFSGNGIPSVDVPNSGMARVQNKLLKSADAAWKGTNDAYDAARAAGSSGYDTTATLGLHDQMATNFAANFNAQAAPKAQALLDDLKNTVANGGGRPGLPATTPQGDASTTISSLEHWRQRATAAANDGGADGKAIRQMIQQYDDFANRAIDDGLIHGDQAAVELWQKARGLRRDFGKRFETNDMLGNLLEVSPDSGKVALKLQPSEAMNMLFTSNAIGAKTGAVNTLKALKTELGPDSPEWAALKEEAFMRLTRGATSGADRGADLGGLFSGDKFARAVDHAYQSAPELMNTIFTPADQSLIQTLKRATLYATNRTAGALNPSGTAGRIKLLVDKLASNGIVGKAASAVLSKTFGWIDTATARAAAHGAMPASSAGAGLGSAVVGTPANQAYPFQQAPQPY